MEALEQVLKAEEEARKIRENARAEAARILEDARVKGTQLIRDAELDAQEENKRARDAFEKSRKDAQTDALGAGELKSLALQKGADERIEKAADALLDELTR